METRSVAGEASQGAMEDQPWRGLTWGGLANRVYQRVELCKKRAEEHAARANKWVRWALPLSWVTAVVAAVSGVSVVADSDGPAATILSLLTALFAGTNAALNPSETARKHKVAANNYHRMVRKLEDFAYFETEAETDPVPAARRSDLQDRIRELEEELNGIEEASP